MAARLLVDNLIAQVRSILDENNAAQVNDESDILPALNRAQDHATSILARRYDAPLITYIELELEGGKAEYDIPEDAFEERIEKVEINTVGVYHEAVRLDYRRIFEYETALTAAVPSYYAIIGNKIRFIPKPSGTYNARIWYPKDPPPLAKSQGRITLINIPSNYVVVDSVGSSISVLQGSLNSFVNIVDGQTGEIKVTLQVQSITGNRVTFKTVPTQDKIETLAVEAVIPDTVEKGDYLVVAPNTCISFYKKPISNFLIQYAVAELQRKLGTATGDLELRVLDELRRDVERSWAGQESSLRVKLRHGRWRMFRNYDN